MNEQANGRTASNGTALAVRAPQAMTRIEPRSMGEVFELAAQLAKARGFVPEAFVEKPAAIAAVILTGTELGIGPMEAMREIHMIKGKPSISATLMLKLAQREGIKTRFLVSNSTIATIGVTVPGLAEQTMSFTQADATRAGLWGQGNWKTYPDAMLRARAISSAIKAFCPAVVGGSVYESDSGELTDGIPTGDVIEGSLVEPSREQPKSAPQHSERDWPPRKLSDCADAEALKAWCAKYGAQAVAANKAGPIMTRAEKVGVSFAVARGWLGIPEPTPEPEAVRGFNPEEQDAPPPDDGPDVD